MFKKIILFLTVSFLYANPYNVPDKYYDELVRLCTEYKIPVNYAARLFEWESRWDENYININKDGSKDYGLGQHHEKSIPDFILRYNKNIPYNPLYWKDNLRISIIHLTTLRKNIGNWFGTFAAYNMGLTGYYEWRNNKRIMPEATKKELEFIFG